MTQTIVISAFEMSGLAKPTYPSAAANKSYIDTISSNIDTRLDALGGFNPANYRASSNLWGYVSTQSISSARIESKYIETISSNALVKYLASSAFKRSNWNPSTWDASSVAWNNATSSWDSKARNLSALRDVSITTPQYGEALLYGVDGGTKWTNDLPPLTFNIANIRLSAQQAINITRFKCPGTKKVRILQASACNSAQNAIHGLFVQVLSGSRIQFKTSSATLRQGYPISSTQGGNTTIRFGITSNVSLVGTRVQYGTAFIQIGVW
jgi:hypothetical protein